jgi:hypothetical protein
MELGPVQGWSDGAGLWTRLGLASAMGWSGSARGLMGLWARCGDGLGCPVGWGRGLDWVAGREQLRPLGAAGWVVGCRAGLGPVFALLTEM